jgi:AraC family L-rhamnose operon regulatory protein RhaS
MRAPVYKERGKTYHADSCEALRAAVARGELRFDAVCRGGYPGRQIPGRLLGGVCSVGFWDAARAQSWGLPWHRNEGVELTWLESGALDFQTEGGLRALQPGDLTIARPWQPHRLGNPRIGASHLHWLILDIGVRQPHQAWRWPEWVMLTREDLAELTDFLRRNEEPVWKDSADIARCFRQMTGSLDGDIARCASKLTITINELLLNLLELLRARDVRRCASLTTARRSAELFLGTLKDSLDEPWTLDAMSDACGLGVTRFVHYCKLVTNLPPAKYLNVLRLERAATLLAADPAASVTDVAFRCGFSSSQYFATLFRQQYRCTPKAFRSEPAMRKRPKSVQP